MLTHFSVSHPRECGQFRSIRFIRPYYSKWLYSLTNCTILTQYQFLLCCLKLRHSLAPLPIVPSLQLMLKSKAISTKPKLIDTRSKPKLFNIPMHTSDSSILSMVLTRIRFTFHLSMLSLQLLTLHKRSEGALSKPNLPVGRSTDIDPFDPLGPDFDSKPEPLNLRVQFWRLRIWERWRTLVWGETRWQCSSTPFSVLKSRSKTHATPRLLPAEIF